MGESGPLLPQDLLASIHRLPDDELIARVRTLAARERRETALLVAHLSELDTRGLYLRAGCSSLFVYCRDVLALAEHDAYNRIEVGRVARRFPAVLDLHAAGATNLTTLRLLGPLLTPANHLCVLESARGKRKAEVEEIVARLAPFPEPPSFVRKLPPPRVAAPAASPQEFSQPVASPAGPLAPEASPSPAGEVLSTSGPATARVAPARGASPPDAAPRSAPFFERPAPSGEVTPFAPDRYRLQVTIGGATLEKLRLAKDMLRHAIPTGDDAAVLDRALTALLA
jgi:hypothetical protein